VCPISSLVPAYEDFFILFKDADPNVPILTEAKNKFAELK
jgi:hypothetical protein